MNYEKEYKKLKADIEKAYLFAQTDSTKSVLEHILPELKESEDERTRKEIISFLQLPHPQFVGERKQEKWITWLEKQGKCETDCHHNHQDANYPNGCIVLEDFNGGEGFYKVHLDYLNKKQVEEIEEMIKTWNKDSKVPNENIKSCIGMCLTDVCEQRFRDYNTSLKDCLAWLEKQGGKKETLCDKCRKEQPSHSCQDITALGRCAIEELAQQEEPQVYEIEDGNAITYSETDGYKVVEPKFKVGDWIVTDKNHICLIDEDCSTTGYSYRLISQNGKVEVGDYNVVDEHARLWTIQDAKPGDVLATELNGYYPFVAIYKEQNGEYLNSHCFIGFNGEFYEGQNGHTNHSIHPATKEQRDLLFQKMKKSGYEWDDENKELKTNSSFCRMEHLSNTDSNRLFGRFKRLRLKKVFTEGFGWH